MIRFDNRITIDATPAELFSYLADPTHLPEWNHYVQRVTPLDGSEPRRGARYHQQRRTDDQIFEITELERPIRLSLRTLPDQRPAFTRTMTLTPVADGRATELVDRWELETGHPPLMERMARSGIRGAVRENLGKLAELMEVGATNLQDGRVTTRFRPTAMRS